MFFALSKLLGFFLKPFDLIFILVLLSFLIKHGIWRKRLRWAALIMFLFFTNGIIFNECLLLWEKPAKPISELEETYELAVVLGGTADVDREPSDRLFFHRGAERITHALNLYHAGKVKKILFTGGRADLFEDRNRDNSPIREFYIMCGVKSVDIFMESSSRNTRENALLVKEMIEKNSMHGKIILITSAYHMRRAEGCFNKAGMDVTGFSVDFLSNLPKDRFGFNGFLPSSEVLTDWNILIKEWVGYVVYWIVGYI